MRKIILLLIILKINLFANFYDIKTEKYGSLKILIPISYKSIIDENNYNIVEYVEKFFDIYKTLQSSENSLFEYDEIRLNYSDSECFFSYDFKLKIYNQETISLVLINKQDLVLAIKFYTKNGEIEHIFLENSINNEKILSSKQLLNKALYYKNILCNDFENKYKLTEINRRSKDKIYFYFYEIINNYLTTNETIIELNLDGTLNEFSSKKYELFENENLKKLITKEKAYEIAEAFLREKAVEWEKISAEDIKKLIITPPPKTLKLKYQDRPVNTPHSVFDGMHSNRPMYVFPNYYYIKNPYSIPEDSILIKFENVFPSMFEINWIMKLRLAYPVLLVGNMPINIFFITKSNMTGFYIDAETGEVIGGW
ncbi:MAG: hypothetical protein WC002_09000 [Candidatus Muiribacteriota bacterium]